MTAPLRIGLAGLGTVGAGLVTVLQTHGELLAARAGRPLELVAVSARSRSRDRGVDLSAYDWEDDPVALAAREDIDLLVEVMGGEDGPAKVATEAALSGGRHVVTANKAMMARHGTALATLAEEHDAALRFEAAVAGGIPIVKALNEGMAANRINRVLGVMNGTCNYILTQMEKTGGSYDDILAEAQALGYAEADPTFDVEGIDAAHKLTILASIAYGVPLQFDKAFTEGISRITAEDVEQADNLGYVIKHLGISKRTEAGLELRVHPTLIPKERLLASVHGVKNAIAVMGDAVGPTLYYGAGAGAEPTASAVVADLLDVARDISTDHHYRVPYLAFSGIGDDVNKLPIMPMEDIITAYYLRLLAVDRPGVLARVATILAEQGISIEALIQKEATEGELVPIILLTHRTREKQMNEAIRLIESLADIAGPVTRIRVESLDEQE